MQAPDSVELTLGVPLPRADVVLLVDATGSMTQEIDRLRATFVEEVLPAMQELVVDLQLAVAAFGDFWAPPYGRPGPDRPFVLLQRSTADAARVARALEDIPWMNGGDGPESQLEALYQMATGEGRGHYVDPAGCPGVGQGALCLRPGAEAAALLFTDAAFHNAPDGMFPYDPEVLGVEPATYVETVDALGALGARVLGLYSGPEGSLGEAHLAQLVRDTGAVSAGGEPLLFRVGRAGERLDGRVVEAVGALARQTPVERVELRLLDVPGDGRDAAALVESVAASAVVPAEAATTEGAAFTGVRPGARLTFTLRLSAPDAPGRHALDAVLWGGGTELGRERLEIVAASEPCDD